MKRPTDPKDPQTAAMLREGLIYGQRRLLDARGVIDAIRTMAGEAGAPHINAALQGDESAAGRLSAAMHASFAIPMADGTQTMRSHARALLAWMLWRLGVPKPACRAALEAAWLQDPEAVMNVAGGDRDEVRRMFAEAEFLIPEMPARVTLWRGVAGVPLETARRGMTWSGSRERACRTALEGGAEPLVVRCEVDRSEVLFRSGDAPHDEYLVIDPADCAVDGDADDWRRAAARLLS